MIIYENSFITNFNNLFDYETSINKQSTIIITLDNDIIFDINCETELDKIILPYSNKCIPYNIKTDNISFYKEHPSYNNEKNELCLKSLNDNFKYHSNWALNKPSKYNCVYYILSPKKEVLSILKISKNRYMFSYDPLYITHEIMKLIIINVFIN